MKNLFLILLVLAANLSFSQIKMQGIVKDSIGTPLELANVIAINQETSALESYAITDDKGKYMLSLGKNGTYKLQVSYIGLKTYEQVITTKEEDITKDFNLQPDNALDAVELTYEMPVTIKGDTLIYNADSFKNGSERKLEDVLKKLPGVEINADGQIEVEGKVVQKLMVDGKDFFDGDTKLATKNIPSNAVDKVQVLKNYSEVGQLSGVRNNQDNVAINIKLKEGKSNFWFGNVTLGGGVAPKPNDELYIVQPKLFYYSPKYSLNFIGDFNNTGEIALTGRDLRNFTGGFRSPSSSSGTNLSLGGGGLGFLNLQNNRAQQIETKLGAGNFSYSPNKALDLSGFAIYNSSRIGLQENTFIRYTDPELGIPDEATEQKTRQASDVGLLKLSASYKPNLNNQLDYDILGRLSNETQNQNLVSSVLGSTNQVEENTPYSINQNLNYYYTLNENNIFALEVQHLIQDEDPFYNAILEDKDSYETTADGIGLDPDQLTYDFGQNRRIKSNQLDSKIDYWNILNTKSNINFSVGTILSSQKFNTNIFQFLDDGSQINPVPTFNDGLATNDVEYNFSDIYVGTRYTLKLGKFTIAPAVSFHAYGNKNLQLGEEYGENFFRVLPDLDVRWQLKNSESLTFRYNMQNQFTDVSNLARGLVLNNFNSLFIGNPELDNGLSHNINLRFQSFNLFNFTNIFASINYSSRVDQIRNIVNFENVVRTSTVFNSAFADESVTAFGRYQRTFGKLTGSMQGNFNYSKFNQFIQGNQSVNESFNQNYSARLRTNFREAPNVSLRYDYGIQDNNQGTSRTKFFTNAPSIEFDAYIWKSVTFTTNYAYNSLSNEDEKLNSFEFWDASLAYRKNNDSKWEYEIKGTNLLNTKSQAQTSAGNVSVTASEYFIQPRFITFRVRYEL
jgi:hypothetical protein